MAHKLIKIFKNNYVVDRYDMDSKKMDAMDADKVINDNGAEAFIMHKTYAKDISLETNVIDLSEPEKGRNYNVDYSFTADKKGNFIEVDFGARISIKKTDKILCILEIVQTALFTIKCKTDTPEELYAKIITIHCPIIVFPYLKQNLENILSRSPLKITEFYIEPIDFVAAAINAAKMKDEAVQGII